MIIAVSHVVVRIKGGCKKPTIERKRGRREGERDLIKQSEKNTSGDALTKCYVYGKEGKINSRPGSIEKDLRETVFFKVKLILKRRDFLELFT